MTKKHKIRKSKHLLESKKDVDENVENILRMIEEENEQTENEQDDSGNPVRKSKLSSLVKGFHEDYQYLHKHYKQLISKLETAGHSSSGSDSSDSDVEGDRLENNVTTPKAVLNEENGLNHKLDEVHSMEAEIEMLKQSTEEHTKEISDLKQLLEKAIKDKEATRGEFTLEVANLSSENENLKSLVETAKREEGDLLNIIKSKENEVKTLSSEKQTIEEERDNLKMSVVDMKKEMEDLSNQLKDTVDKCSVMASELEKSLKAEKEVQTLFEENQNLKNHNLMLSVEHDNLKALHHNLDIECCQLKATIAETKAENESLTTENHSAERKLQQLRVEIDGLMAETTVIMNNLDKERSTAAEEKERLTSENSVYMSELEEAQSNVKDLEKELESTKSVLNNRIAELCKEKNSTTSEIERLEASLMNHQNDLSQQLDRISDMQKTTENLELANSNLHNEIVKVQGQKNEAVASIVNLESMLEQQVQEIANLQEANKELKAAKTDLHNEVMLLQQEKIVALTQLQEYEAQIKNLRIDLEQQCNQISVMQQANEETQDKNSSLHKQLEETRIHLQEEIIALQGEKEEAISSLQQSNDSLKTLEVQLEQQREQISVLQLAHEDLQNSNSNLEMQLEEAKVSHHAEILALQDEKNKIISELQQSDGCIKNLRFELEQGKEQTSILLHANEDMKNNISVLDKQLEEVRSSLHAEIAEVRAEKETALSELHMSQTSIRNLESVVEKQTENILTLEKANDKLNNKICILTEQVEQAKAELHKEVAAIQEEKDTALTQLRQSEFSIQDLENEVTRLKDELSIQLEKNSTLDKQFEEFKSKLHAEILDLRAEKDTSLLELQTSQDSVRNLEILVEKQTENISTLHQANDELQKNIYTLTEQSQQAKEEMQDELKAIQEEKDTVLTQLKQSETSVQNLEDEVTRLKEELSVQLENNSTLDKQFAEARSNLHAEISDLRAEKGTSLLELQMSQASVRNLEILVGKQTENISTLQQANEELQKNIYTLTEQSQQVKVEMQSDLKAIQEEKNAVLSQLKQSETSVQNLENEVIRLKEELSVQLENNSTLDKQFAEARSNLHAEISDLHTEKDTSLRELQTSQACVRNLEIVVEKQTENISTLQQANDELQKNVYTLTEQSQQAKVEMQDELKSIQEEKDAALTQLKLSETSVQNLENEVTRLKWEFSVQLENNSTLDKQLEEAMLKVSSLHENLEKAQAEAACQLDGMSTKTKDLEETINQLSSQKTKLEKDVKIMIEACTENMSCLAGFEDRVTQKISDQEAGLKVLHQSLGGAVGSCQRLQYAYDEVSTRASHLEILKRSQMEQIDQLEQKNTETVEKHRLLEEEKLSANKENIKLQKHVQDLEVQLQLAKQKLKVTEAESKCKEERYEASVEALRAEICHLEQLVQQFSGRVSLLEGTLMQVKGHAESVVCKWADKLDELETICSQNFVLFIDRSSACSDELKILRKKVHDHLNEQKELANANNELAIRFKEKEMVVSEMVKSAAEAQTKMLQLQKTVDEKEDELAARVQEKREAIKQLSDTIVYHKNYSDDLVRYIRSQSRPRLPFCL
ncbi:Myosin heavy chain-like [Zea mays]|uniref:Myosin heavy chain-like n=1 Tax=Zea mays TaxID=4577 RepID=A0A1D6NGY9_MAIZE|nr:Myosin heavy chain-like [Zea mays]